MSTIYKSVREQMTYVDHDETHPMTQHELGRQINISEDILSDIENGNIVPGQDVVIKISEVGHIPQLLPYHCTRECPIGKVSFSGNEKLMTEKVALTKPIDVIKTGTRLMVLFQGMKSHHDRIADIVEDSCIEAREIPELKDYMAAMGMDHIPHIVAELHAWISGQTDLAAEDMKHPLKSRSWYPLRSESDSMLSNPYKDARIRGNRGVTQTRVAERIRDLYQEGSAPTVGTLRNTISVIESGKVSPDRNFVPKLAKALKAPELRSYYCSRCKIGEILHRPYCNLGSLSQTSFSLLLIFSQVSRMEEAVAEIFNDFRVTADEKETFFQLMDHLDKLAYCVESLKLCLEKKELQEE